MSDIEKVPPASDSEGINSKPNPRSYCDIFKSVYRFLSNELKLFGLGIHRFFKRAGLNTAILVFVFIISIFLVSASERLRNPTGKDRDLIQSMLFGAKIIAMLWLVLVPVMDYFGWSKKQNLNKWLSRVFNLMFFLIFLIIIVLVAAVLHPFCYEKVIMNNRVFFLVFAIFPLCVLYWADRLIRDYIKEQEEKAERMITAHEHSLDSITLTAADKIELNQELIDYKRIKSRAKSAWDFYDNSVKYADSCIIISLLITYVLYLNMESLLSLFLSATNMPIDPYKIDIFFEGALTFQVIISTVIYFFIAYKYDNAL